MTYPDRKPSAAASVRLELEREINDGILVPGDTLDEEALAARFGVSRTPVREALLHLSVLGIVTIAPRAGIYVSRLSMPELLAFTEMLAELEAVCAKLATRRIRPEEAEALKRIHEESRAFEETGDVQGYAHCNARFHEILYQACRNAPLAAEIARIRSRTRVYRRSVFQNQLRIRRSREDHERMLDAILAGNASAAAEAALVHISGSLGDLTDMISQVPTQLLAVDTDYPGKHGLEQQRETMLRAMAQRGDRTSTAEAVTSSGDAKTPAGGTGRGKKASA
ncbi:MAG TPA: GntR family transcriptional regulator [Paraburkholderia sp.]|uniref:GntR family transcriptional regulator n=1 Tax=Paraburkholderia sp. TaxID=1926495 RepID=UPI002B4A3E74|nr:GntR family transcriptional regulator [Paraburkholderia sp.]HKR42293.1 GntR family transcriptional regulator [Paraburkholderia sp.]